MEATEVASAASASSKTSRTARIRLTSGTSGSSNSVGGDGGANTTLAVVPSKSSVPPPPTTVAKISPTDKDFCCCRYCGRDSNCPNPLPQKHQGQLLKLASKSVCLPCRNFHNRHKSCMQPSTFVCNQINHFPESAPPARPSELCMVRRRLHRQGGTFFFQSFLQCLFVPISSFH